LEPPPTNAAAIGGIDPGEFLLTKAGLSARQLSYAADVSPHQITRFELGQTGIPIARIEWVFAVLGYELELMSTHPEGEEADTSWIKDL